MALTTKQERFCIEVVKQSNYSDAYRIAYDASSMSDETINRKASELMSNGKITARVKELQAPVVEEARHTLKDSIEQDQNLIKRYEHALNLLSCVTTPEIDLKAAERTIKYIGAGGYNGAKDRLNKIAGHYEKDNSQKGDKITLIERRVINKNDSSN